MAEARALRRRNPKHQARAVTVVPPVSDTARPEEAGAESRDGGRRGDMQGGQERLGQGDEEGHQNRSGRVLFPDRVCWGVLQRG
eukprot:8844624-Alexandrium_andersonii.AAC.1